MRYNRKVVPVLMAALMGLSALAGCGGGGNESASAAPAESTAPASSTAEADSGSDSGGEGQVNMRFSWWGGDARHEATIEAINLYMERNPQVKIDAEYGGYDGYQQKITTQLAGGTEPDIMQLDQPWMVEFSLQNPDFFVDMASLGDKIDLSGFSQEILDDYCTYGGKLVGLPTGTAGMTFMANQAVLDGAGISFGETMDWNDLLEQGKKLNESDPEKYLLNMNNGAVSYFMVRVYLYQLTGGPLVNDDYTLKFTADELRQAYEYIVSLRDANVLDPYEDAMLFNEDVAQNPKWNTGHFGGWLNWSSTTHLQDWGEDAVILPFPVMEGAKQSGIIVRPSQILSVSTRSPHTDEAVKFVDYFFNDEEAILALGDTRSIPATTKARDLLEEKGIADQLSIRSVNISLQNPGEPETPLSTNPEVLAPIENAVEKIMYRQIEVDAAVDETITLMEDVLGNLKASRG